MENIVYKGNFIRVSEERIEGQVFERAYILDSLVVLPFTRNGEILLVKERRPHEQPPVRWKPVTGFCEEGETPEQTANRELQEEIGKKAGRMSLYLSLKTTGTINNTLSVMLAGDLADAKLPNPDGEDTIVEVRAFSMDEVFQKAMEGELGRGAVGYVLLRLYHDLAARKSIICS